MTPIIFTRYNELTVFANFEPLNNKNEEFFANFKLLSRIGMSISIFFMTCLIAFYNNNFTSLNLKVVLFCAN